MELTYDWKGYRALFGVQKKAAGFDDSRPIYLVTEGKTVISAFCENEDLSDLVGAGTDEIDQNFSHRELVKFDRKEVDEWLSSATALSHFPDETEHLRSKAKPRLEGLERYKNAPAQLQNHFVLEATQSWWHKLLPATYGILIRIDGGKGPSLFLVVQRKKIISFRRPDLGEGSFTEAVRNLSEKDLIPVQGLDLTSQQWAEWSESPNPWKPIFALLRGNLRGAKPALVPFRSGLFFLITLRAFLRI